MAVHLRDGYYGTCTSPGSGTGAYTGVTAVAGFRSFATLTDGDQVTVAVRSATGWGEDILATKSGGSTPTLTRTQILSNINSNTSPIDWPAGTPLVIYSSVSGVEIASLLKQNTWQDHQLFNGKRVVLSTDANTYWYSPNNDQAYLALAGATHLRAYKNTVDSNENVLQVIWTDAGGTLGPGLITHRISTSPANGDGLGYLAFLGRNAAGVDKNYGVIHGRIDDVTASSENGAFLVNLMNNGVLTNAMTIGPLNTVMHPSAGGVGAGVLVNKTVNGLGNNGLELLANGQIFATTGGASAPLGLNRNLAGAGTLVDFFRQSAPVGSITVNSAGDVLYNPFLGAHYSEWHQSVENAEQWEDRGTVVCTADGVLPGFGDRLPLVRPSQTAGDKRVYGVVVDRLRLGDADAVINEPARGGVGYLQIGGVGAGVIKVVGYVEAGDFLETSDTPGAARAQVSEFKTNATVAKATQSSPDDGTVRLCACTYEAS